ncbi:uncharacterized protein PAE49_004973 isoform 2-T2 [Odontesthes bonariensis]|uniref:uncharacterized protein LOC142380469 isoform X2 n=1 Tax=Odontesthes bonariensis TaxID=219752 RepID=UPI003F5881C9
MGQWDAELRPAAEQLLLPNDGGPSQAGHMQQVKRLRSDMELLLAALSHLREAELQSFREILQGQLGRRRLYSDIPQRLLATADRQDAVFLLVEAYGQRSVEMTTSVLEKMQRADLVEKLRFRSLSKEVKMDEHLSPLIQKVAEMAAVREQLLETLKFLTPEDLKILKWFLQLTYFHMGLPQIPWSQLVLADQAAVVDQLVKVCGRRCAEVAADILTDVGEFELAFVLSETSSKTKGKQEELWPGLNQKAGMMKVFIELLLETLRDLTDRQLEGFKRDVLLQISRDKRYPSFHSELVTKTDLLDTALLMVQTYGQQSVGKSLEVLRKLNRPDLVRRLSESSSRSHEKLSVGEQHPALIQKVAAMAAVKQLLLDTLNCVSDNEQEFKKFLQLTVSQRNLSHLSSRLSLRAGRAEMVDVMVETLGQQAVEVIREVLMKMSIYKSDLVQNLPERRSGIKERHSVEEDALRMEDKEIKLLLMKTQNDFSQKDFEKFRWLLQFTFFQRGIQQIPKYRLEQAETPEGLAELLVETLGARCVEVAREVLLDMNRADLVKLLPETSSTPKDRSSWLKPETNTKQVMANLLEIFQRFSKREFEDFKRVQQRFAWSRGFKRIPRFKTKVADRLELVELMMEMYGQQTVEVTTGVLQEMNRSDLVEMLSGGSSASRGASGGVLPLRGCFTVIPLIHPFHVSLTCPKETSVQTSPQQDSGGWTKVEPEVKRADPYEAPTYSLQSDVGHFECSISGLRWVCKEKVGFRYQFGSWDGHMERMESRRYSPAGPLMDVTVTAGRLDEVHLPHWICIDDIPKLLDNFAVLHINDCGEVLEKVSEVTPTHVKLAEPSFTSLAAVINSIFRVKINCNMLIYYQPNEQFLKLRVYLIPHDAALQQKVHEEESSSGYEVIKKPRPDTPLRIHQGFTLTASMDAARIQPEKLTLRYDSQDPNFFEVFIERPYQNFDLGLYVYSKRDKPVWSCEIRKVDHPKSGAVEAAGSSGGAACGPTSAEDEHFVDKHMEDLIQRVSATGPILDALLRNKVIQPETYETIRALPTSQGQIRELFCGPLRAGEACKDIFLSVLREKEPLLMADLNRRK